MRKPTTDDVIRILHQLQNYNSENNRIVETETQYIMVVEKKLSNKHKDEFGLAEWENPFLSEEENELRRQEWVAKQEEEQKLIEELCGDMCK